MLIGERRLRAIRYLGHCTAPAIVATISAEMADEVQLMENIQREDLPTKDLACAIKSLWSKHGSVAEVAKRCHKSPSWVSKRLALALNVGTSTATLIDGNIKDVELLYNFAKLEKVDAKMARDLMPEVLTGAIGRETIKAAILENWNGESLTPTPPDAQNLDLFATAVLLPNTQQTPLKSDPIAPAPVQTAAFEDSFQQQYAQMHQALESIRDMDKSLSPLVKAEKMRAIARACLAAFV